MIKGILITLAVIAMLVGITAVVVRALLRLGKMTAKEDRILKEAAIARRITEERR